MPLISDIPKYQFAPDQKHGIYLCVSPPTPLRAWYSGRIRREILSVININIIKPKIIASCISYIFIKDFTVETDPFRDRI